MRSLSGRLDVASAAIDAANADDPTQVVVRGALRPLAQVHGELAAAWVTLLDPSAQDTVVLAARAHHLRRWVVPRVSYPEGRAGYLRWRRDQKRRHATEVAELLADAGYDTVETERVGELIRREGLGTDPETQLVEDAACLVFIETQLSAMANRFEHEHLLEVIRRTSRKMSEAALAAVGDIPLDSAARSLLRDALGS